jgi:hypothetical protein
LIFGYNDQIGWTDKQIMILEDSLLRTYFNSTNLSELEKSDKDFYELYFDKKNQQVKIGGIISPHPLIPKDLSEQILNQKLNDFSRLKVEGSMVSKNYPTKIELGNIKGKWKGRLVQEDYFTYLNNNAFSFDSSSQLYLLDLNKKQKVICAISPGKDKLYGIVVPLSIE